MDKPKIEITNRCNQLLLSLRDSWFPNEKDPMPVGDFIYVICCALIYRKPTLKYKRKPKK
tara:strand:+ start:739 stop:918 length:180 start_codon:yes stop_codon:yes gene_type:complete